MCTSNSRSDDARTNPAFLRHAHAHQSARHMRTSRSSNAAIRTRKCSSVPRYRHISAPFIALASKIHSFSSVDAIPAHRSLQTIPSTTLRFAFYGALRSSGFDSPPRYMDLNENRFARKLRSTLFVTNFQVGRRFNRESHGEPLNYPFNYAA